MSVWLSTIGTGLRGRDRVVIAWMAPRGIVAAAVASVFALRLQARFPQAGELVSVTFLVIVSTVLVYGATILPIARRLGVADPNPQGFLIIGAHSWARSMAELIRKAGLRVVVVDTNRDHIAAARLAGIEAMHGSALSTHLVEGLDHSGLGRLLALTPNDGVNTLACQRFEREFGRQNVYKLAPAGKQGKEGIPSEMHGRVAFGTACTFTEMASRFGRGMVLKATRFTEQFGMEEFRAQYGESALPLFIKRKSGEVITLAANSDAQPAEGDTLITVVSEPKEGQGGGT